MEAWECIAGELPPGAARGRGRYCDYFGHENLTALEAWACFTGKTGITKRAYAELIAPQRVREAAEAKVGEGHNVEVHFCSLGRVIVDVVSPIDARRLFGHGQGPDICTAAWEAIQALGGGE